MMRRVVLICIQVDSFVHKRFFRKGYANRQMSAACQRIRTVAIHTTSAYHGISEIFYFSRVICSNLGFASTCRKCILLRFRKFFWKIYSTRYPANLLLQSIVRSFITMSSGKWPTRKCWQLTARCYLRFILKKANKISDIYNSNQTR